MFPGPIQLVIILVIVLIFFGAGKLPEVFASFGEGMKRFRDAQRDSEPEDVTPKKREIKKDDRAEDDAEEVEAPKARRKAELED